MKIDSIATDNVNCPKVKFLNVEGLKATQSHRVLELLNELYYEGFEIAIEIGTQQGGFSLLLKEYLKCEVHTWDITEWQPITLRNRLFKKYGVNQRIEDCFEDYRLMELLNDDRRKIVFCDGGHKSNEFNFFADFINEGDYIGAHDYFEKSEDVDYTIWTTCEIEYENIKPAVEKNELKQRYREQSLDSVWALYEKTIK